MSESNIIILSLALEKGGKKPDLDISRAGDDKKVETIYLKGEEKQEYNEDIAYKEYTWACQTAIYHQYRQHISPISTSLHACCDQLGRVNNAVFLCLLRFGDIDI